MVQQHQKYDELRFDMKPTGDKELDNEIEIIFDDAEDKSLKICVYCGLAKEEGALCSCRDSDKAI